MNDLHANNLEKSEGLVADQDWIHRKESLLDTAKATVPGKMTKCRTQPSPAKIQSIEDSPPVVPDESLGEQLHILIRADGPTLWERIIVVALVVLAHFAGFLAYWAQPEMPRILVNEMSVSFANVQMQQEDVKPQPKSKFKPREPDPVPAEVPAVKEVAQPAQPVKQDATPPSPVVLDTEPDYRADYLNNPRPPYPLVARRMGYHGTVVLNVEVLAEGKTGQVLLHQSSGFDILDNAALQTIKTWRFSSARHFGQPVTMWFLVPIKFTLEGNET
jgi:protein TonB